MSDRVPQRGQGGRAWRWGAAIVATAIATAMPGPIAAQDDASASALPVVAGAVSVRGTSTLVGQLDPGITVVEDGIVRTRGSVLLTVERSSDSRVSGEATITLHVDAYPGAEGDALSAQVRYGSMRLENEEGAWEGAFTGRLNGSGFLQTYWLAGEGAYAGWSYVVTAGGDGDVWFSDGLIYPGELPSASTFGRLPIERPGRELPSV